MPKTVGILAPFSNNETFEADFVIRLKHNKRELTLSCIDELIRNNYSFDKIKRGYDYFNSIIPAAGYYLSSVLRKNGYNTVLSQKIDDNTLKNFAINDPVALCISTTMILKNITLKEIIKRVREFMPDIIIILGGIFIWKSYKNFINLSDTNKIKENDNYAWGVFPCTKKEIDADIIIVETHGIPTLFKVLKEIEKGRKGDFTHIPNIAIPDNKDEFYFTGREQEDPYFINEYTHWDLLDELPAWIPIRTSVGCAFRCNFCDFCHIYPKVYLRGKESILNELKLLRKLFKRRNSVSLLHLTDDNIFFNDKRTKEICSTIIDSKINTYWVGFIRASSVKKSNIDLIKRSRLMHTLIGIESGDSSQLKRIKKMQNIEETKRGIQLLDRAKISVVASFLVGFPGESEETINNTAKFINNLDLSEFLVRYHLYPFILFPLSEINKPGNRDKWKLNGMFEHWSHSTMNSDVIKKKCYDLFKKVNSLPYYYSADSIINIFKLNYYQRKRFFELRKDLTVQLIDKVPWNNIKDTFNELSKIMELNAICPDNDFRDEFSINFNPD